MKESHDTTGLPDPQYYDARNSGPLMLGLLVVGGIAIFASLAWGFANPEEFAYSWLYSFMFFFTICAGGFFWVILHHATDSGWSVTVRRQVENLSSLFPLLLLFFIPVILMAKPQLYSWMNIAPNESHILDVKAGYLNEPWFWVRTALYFVFFIAASLAMRILSVRQDSSSNPRLTIIMRIIAVASLPFFAVSLTFASIDWVKSLDYTWYSTMWGVYLFAGSALSSMAVLIITLTVLRAKGYLEGIVTPEHFHIMGKLLLAFSIFWAYIGFSQYMLIWYANIPEEASYFIRRNTESWNTMSIILVVGHFFIPFLLLLNRTIKKTPVKMSIVAGWILIMHWLDMYLIVMPLKHPLGVSLNPADILLNLLPLVGIGCILAVFFIRRMGKVSLFASRDPRIVESLYLSN